MKLNFTKEDDDLKFLFYYFDKETIFTKSGETSLEDGNTIITDINIIIEKIFELAQEECNKKKIADFKRYRI